ncbi:MAG: PIG-L family deacetylase [Candidatus Didemnitutus sp.]|nr:PIG-L family deacetylase [Candidatus Didemnitutus sp.]
MKFFQATADVLVPEGAPLEAALARTTHLSIAAHQDDIEIMAYHGIAACRGRADAGFTGVIVTDGAGSSRTGVFADYPDEQMKNVRRDEQRAAARLGGYAAMIQLAHPSAAVKDAANTTIVDDLRQILSVARPQVVYLHNPADKHDTHIAVLLRSLAAFRELPLEQRPTKIYGCEVWRDLDWLLDADKCALDVSASPQLAADLVALFASQIAGGKRYDLATAGRRLANATFHTAHSADGSAALTWAIDLTPLVQDAMLSVEEFTVGYVERLRADVVARLRKFS